MIRTLWKTCENPLAVDSRPLLWPYGADGKLLPNPFDPDTNPLIKEAMSRGCNVDEKKGCATIFGDNTYFDNPTEAWVFVFERLCLIKRGRTVMVSQEIQENSDFKHTWRYELRWMGDHYEIFAIKRDYSLGRGFDTEQEVIAGHMGHPREFAQSELHEAMLIILQKTSYFARWQGEDMADKIDKQRSAKKAQVHSE